MRKVKHWLAGPDMKYWSQQLNFATWWVTTGCAVSRDIFDEDNSTLQLPPQIRSFFKFHVYFTARRILYQLGGPTHKHALPDDPTFGQKNNPYDKAAYGRIYRKFGVDVSSDFRYTRGSAILHNWAGGPRYQRHPDDTAYNQYDWFCPNNAQGLTQVGLSRVNQLIEAFVYCVLGAQVNLQSSIVGEGGRAKEAQSEFLVLLEDVVEQPDLTKSVQRYQLAVDQAKERLNLAVCPGAWLMPGWMVINTTQSVVRYNNRLKQAESGMKLGINDWVNKGTKRGKNT